MLQRKRLVWFILARLLLLVFFYFSILLFSAREPDFLAEGALQAIQQLCIAAGIFSVVSLSFLRSVEHYIGPFSYTQIIWDLLFVTILLLLTGGISSPYSFLYILSIINASVLLSRREAFYTASLCAILYGSILDLQYYGKLVQIGLSPLAALQYGPTYIFYTIFINISAFYLTAFLTGYLARRAEESEAALQEKAINYEELERLNSSIVRNLTSALLTVNSNRRIRVFNPFAEKLLGRSLAEVYDQQLTDIIPGLFVYLPMMHEPCQGEFEQGTHNGGRITCSFRSVPFTGKEGILQGIIIDIQDITQLKRLESDLQRADRLAAIGELSARIAHEIRNPLAAISGSVQVIAQGGGIPHSDQQLFDIVVRETDRLNQLISDFLAYARPSRPTITPVLLKAVIAEQKALIVRDSRLDRIAIRDTVSDDFRINVDVGQFKQVLWNLLLNAAQSIGDRGVIEIEAEHDGTSDSRVSIITIRDNGAGMSDEAQQRIFEPFYTTKVDGTGLGMATVYRVIEAHGGSITVESEEGTGTIFRIILPDRS